MAVLMETGVQIASKMCLGTRAGRYEISQGDQVEKTDGQLTKTGPDPPLRCRLDASHSTEPE
jgi:hypothetical protein